MSPDTLLLCADLLNQVTFSANIPPDELETVARRVAQAKREIAAALSVAERSFSDVPSGT